MYLRVGNCVYLCTYENKFIVDFPSGNIYIPWRKLGYIGLRVLISDVAF